MLLRACLRSCVLSWLSTCSPQSMGLEYASTSHPLIWCSCTCAICSFTWACCGNGQFGPIQSVFEPERIAGGAHGGVAASRSASDVGRPLLSGGFWRGATEDQPHMHSDGRTPFEDRMATAFRGGRPPEDLTVIGAARLIRQPTQKRAAAAPSADPGADLHWLSGLSLQPHPAAAAPAGEAGMLGDGTAGGLGDLVSK